MRVYNRAMGNTSWTSGEDCLPAGSALGYNQNWQFRYSGGELLMMGANGGTSEYYPTDSNGLNLLNAPSAPCKCAVVVPTQTAVCPPLGYGSCRGGQCEEMPPVLPPSPSPPRRPLSLSFPVYGFWCGMGHPPRVPNLNYGDCSPHNPNVFPQPQDELDSCCCKHDECFENNGCNNLCVWRFSCACVACDLALIACASRADCSRSPNPAFCRRAKAAIILWMALQASRICLY